MVFQAKLRHGNDQKINNNKKYIIRQTLNVEFVYKIFRFLAQRKKKYIFCSFFFFSFNNGFKHRLLIRIFDNNSLQD